MRALLVVNPVATTTSRRTRDILIRALSSELKVDVVETTHRGHAHELAEQARRDGLDVVVTLGGDGTINEVVNGLLSAGPGPTVPALAPVPGGSTNVFTRALGLPRDPIEATAAILEVVRAGEFRTISLGRTSDRWFTFTCGFGYDADVVARVERMRTAGKRSSPLLYLRAATAEFLTGRGRRKPSITVEVPGAEPVHKVFLCLVNNVNPWSYVGGRAIQPTPRARFSSGLDVLALRRVGTVGMLRLVAATMSRTPDPHGRRLHVEHDASTVTLRASRPQGWQVDGDWAGETQSLQVALIPDALRVVAPEPEPEPAARSRRPLRFRWSRRR